MTTVGDTVTARTEAQAAQAAYRTRVRAASLAIVFGLAGVLAVTAILPTTHPVDRGGLLVTAVLVVLAAVLWFGLVPRDAFGPGRIFVAAAIAQGVMVLMLGFTSGVRSPYFPYYLLPVLVMLLSGSPWQSVALGTLSAAGLVGLGIADPVRNDVMRDLAVTRLFELGTMTFFAATTAMATGATRVALAKRTETLAMEREEAFQMAVTDELTGLRETTNMFLEP